MSAERGARNLGADDGVTCSAQEEGEEEEEEEGEEGERSRRRNTAGLRQILQWQYDRLIPEKAEPWRGGFSADSVTNL